MVFNDEIENILGLLANDLLKSAILESFDKLSYCPKIKEYIALNVLFYIL